MTDSRLDELYIPQPPYRMRRPVVKLASAESMPSNTPVLPPELMQELEASVVKPEPVPAPAGPTPAEKAAMTREHTKAIEEDAIRTQVKKEMEAKAVPPPAEFHEEFSQSKETKEQEIHRLAKEALEKLNTYRSFAERNVGQGPPSPAETVAKERAASAQRELDAARKPAAPQPKPVEAEPVEVGSETVYMPAVKEPPAPKVETKPRPVETPKPVEQQEPQTKEESRPESETREGKQQEERERLKKVSEQEYESTIGAAHEEAQKVQNEQAQKQERQRMEAGSVSEYRKIIDAAHEEANKEQVDRVHKEASTEHVDHLVGEARAENLEHPRTREEVAQLAGHIDAMGSPTRPGFWERLPGKSRATLDTFLAGVATALARRQSKKLSYREDKIADHMMKAQIAESRGLIFGTLSGTWHRLWASWHKKRGASAFEGQKHWHMVRSRYEEHRNGILEGIVSQMELPLNVFRNQLEKFQKAAVELDRLMAANDKKIKHLDKDVQDPAKFSRRADILRQIQELAEANMRMRRAKGDLVLKSGDAEAKVIEQEGLVKRILQSTESPFPDTEPKEPSWLKSKNKK